VTAVRQSRELHSPWIEPPDSPARYAQYLARISGPEHAGFLVIDRADGGLVGFININEIVMGTFASGYLGYAAFTGKAGRPPVSGPAQRSPYWGSALIRRCGIPG
jgi:ribosomal-protein-alanine N-acetyltransferase